MKHELEFYFFFGSTYTYLTVMRIDAAAQKAGVPVTWQPFNLRAILTDAGYTPFIGKPAKTRYMWRDIERRAIKLEVPYVGPAAYPVDPDLAANRLGALAADEGWVEGYARAAYRGWFLEGRPLGEADAMAHTLKELGKPVDETLARAESEGAELLEAATEKARALGMFGSPTFAIGEEIFWGDDRLEDALEFAAAD